MKKYLEKLQTIVGGILVLGIVFGLGRSLYNTYFGEQEFTILKATQQASPIKNALFWYEEELEKTSHSSVAVKLSTEADNLVNPLFDNLKNKGLVVDRIKTMSDVAKQKMTELGAYATWKGEPEPTAWEIAEENGNPYLFKVTIIDVTSTRRSNDLQGVKYQFTIHKVADKSIIWQGETTRLGGFFGDMQDPEKTISVLNEHLKEIKIID